MPLPENFDILPQELPERASQRFAAAVRGLRIGLEQQAIRKVELDDAKRALGLAFEKAWEREVAAPFFHAGRFEQHDAVVGVLGLELDRGPQPGEAAADDGVVDDLVAGQFGVSGDGIGDVVDPVALELGVAKRIGDDLRCRCRAYL